MKSARRRSRELALQGLYAWQLAGDDAAGLQSQLAETKGFGKADAEYFSRLLRATIAHAEALERLIAPVLDRKLNELSPVERGILLIAAFDLQKTPAIPYKVVTNQQIESA